jgi:hypothetical protein
VLLCRQKKNREKSEINAQDGKSVVWNKTIKTIEELFDGYDCGDYTAEEVDWGEPTGKELF